MTNHYEALKKKIQEANSEIMELKFGCEVSYMDAKMVFVEVNYA